MGCGLRPPKFEYRNGADSSSLAFVLGEAWIAPRLLGVDAVAFSAGQFADGHLVCFGSAFDTAVAGGGQVVAPIRVGGCSAPGSEDVDHVRVGVVREVHHGVDVLPAAVAAAVMHQDQRGALEGPANPALVSPELRDGLRVPVERVAHVDLLYSSGGSQYVSRSHPGLPGWWGVHRSWSTLAGASERSRHGKEGPEDRDSAACDHRGEFDARLTKEFAGNRSCRKDRLVEVANVRAMLDDRLGVPVSLVDDALGLIFVEVDLILQRPGVLGPHDVHGLRGQALELLDLPLVELEPIDTFNLTQLLRPFQTSVIR